MRATISQTRGYGRVQQPARHRRNQHDPSRTAADRVDDVRIADDFLDPHDLEQTIEGYPAPVRGIFIADA